MLEHGRAIIPIDACHHLILIVVKVSFSFQLCIRRGVTVCLRGGAGMHGNAVCSVQTAPVLRKLPAQEQVESPVAQSSKRCCR